MRGKWESRNGDLLVDQGRVGCPVRQVSVDYERCLACASLRSAFEIEGTHYVRCSRPVDMQMAAVWLPGCL